MDNINFANIIHKGPASKSWIHFFAKQNYTAHLFAWLWGAINLIKVI